MAAVGIATSKGSREFNVDAAAWHEYDGTGTIAAAVIDGTGNNPDVAQLAPVWAINAVRVGARPRGALAGVLACTALVEDVKEFPQPDGVMVLTVCRPGQPAVTAYVGDCRCYGWDGKRLILHTEDHTKGNRMRNYGADEDYAANWDMVPVTSIGRATPATVALREVFEPLIVLTSDGLHDVLSHIRISEIVRANADDPNACATALVDAARSLRPGDGTRADDATALVLLRHQPADPETATRGR